MIQIKQKYNKYIWLYSIQPFEFNAHNERMNFQQNVNFFSFFYLRERERERCVFERRLLPHSKELFNPLLSLKAPVIFASIQYDTHIRNKNNFSSVGFKFPLWVFASSDHPLSHRNPFFSPSFSHVPRALNSKGTGNEICATRTNQPNRLINRFDFDKVRQIGFRGKLGESSN